MYHNVLYARALMITKDRVIKNRTETQQLARGIYSPVKLKAFLSLIHMVFFVKISCYKPMPIN